MKIYDRTKKASYCVSPEEHHAIKYEWKPNEKNTEWSLWTVYFELVITYKPNEPSPFFGTLKGHGSIHYVEFYAWPTLEQAAAGMIDWGLQELSKTYHEFTLYKQHSL